MTAALVVHGGPVPLPVEIRDRQLNLVAAGTVGERIELPAGVYGVSVSLPYVPDFHTVVDLAADTTQTVTLPKEYIQSSTADTSPLKWPAEPGIPDWRFHVNAAITLVEQGQLAEAVELLYQHRQELPQFARALLGFTALQLSDVERAKSVAEQLVGNSDSFALRAALHRAEGDGDQTHEAMAKIFAVRALDFGLPRLTASARVLLAILRDSHLPATPRLPPCGHATRC
jgi:hypothetical protein